ncbi:E3 ubiquitin-protein ligase TRIM39-like [Lissotriton helveticus]
MAAAGAVKLVDEATCAICLEYFKNPVIIDCGHNFCQSCILQCWQEINTNFACPQCRAIFPEKKFRPNRQLGNLVEMVKLHLPSLKPQESVCQKHQQRLQLFCEDDQEPICVVCDRSKDHRTHTVIPVEEAAQKHKKTLQNSIIQMKTYLEDVRRLTSEENEKETNLEAEFQSQTQRIISTFEELHQFLDQEKQDLLSKVEMEHQNNLEKIHMKQTDLEKQNSSFMDQITEMEGKCQQEDVEFLMGVKSLLNRLCIKPEKVAPHSRVNSYGYQATKPFDGKQNHLLCIKPEKVAPHSRVNSYGYQATKPFDGKQNHLYGYSSNLKPTRNSTLNKQSLQKSCTLSAFVLEKIKNLKETICADLFTKSLTFLNGSPDPQTFSKANILIPD